MSRNDKVEKQYGLLSDSEIIENKSTTQSTSQERRVPAKSSNHPLVTSVSRDGIRSRLRTNKLSLPESSQRFRGQKEITSCQNAQSQSYMFPSSTQNGFFGESQMSTTSFNEFKSASTLRFTTSQISFTKAKRFFIKRDNQNGSQYQLPSQLSTKSTSFGCGEKTLIPQYILINARVNPSPQKYAIHPEKIDSSLAKSFGIPYRFYAKTYIPKMAIKEPEASRDLPGVGTYDITQQPGYQKLKYSMLGKGKDLNELFASCAPPCNQYKPVENLVCNARYSKTTFGLGNKFDFTKSLKKTPGPGTYPIPSIFDKFKSMKNLKLQQLSSHPSKINSTQED